jgi:hypothetical protein
VATFVYVQPAVAEPGAVEFGNRLVTIDGVGHLHEAKPARPARIAVPYDDHSIDRTVGCEKLPQLVFGCMETKFATKMFFTQMPLR